MFDIRRKKVKNGDVMGIAKAVLNGEVIGKTDIIAVIDTNDFLSNYIYLVECMFN